MKKEDPRLRAAGKKTPKASKNEKFVKPADDDLKQYWKTGNMLYPVPAVMVSCKGKEEGDADNIVTVAWAGTICSDPAMVSISVRPDRYSHDLIEKSGEFVINLVTRSLTNACDWCGVRSGRDFDKFAETGLHKYKSEYMDTPAIAESPVNIYCKVVKLKDLAVMICSWLKLLALPSARNIWMSMINSIWQVQALLPMCMVSTSHWVLV